MSPSVSLLNNLFDIRVFSLNRIQLNERENYQTNNIYLFVFLVPCLEHILLTNTSSTRYWKQRNVQSDTNPLLLLHGTIQVLPAKRLRSCDRFR